MSVRRSYQWYYDDLYRAPSHYFRDELVAEGSGLLDENGELEIAFDAQKYIDELDSRYRITASVTDLSRRQIDAQSIIFATAKSFFVRAEARRGLSTRRVSGM